MKEKDILKKLNKKDKKKYIEFENIINDKSNSQDVRDRSKKSMFKLLQKYNICSKYLLEDLTNTINRIYNNLDNIKRLKYKTINEFLNILKDNIFYGNGDMNAFYLNKNFYELPSLSYLIKTNCKDEAEELLKLLTRIKINEFNLSKNLYSKIDLKLLNTLIIRYHEVIVKNKNKDIVFKKLDTDKMLKEMEKEKEEMAKELEMMSKQLPKKDKKVIKKDKKINKILKKLEYNYAFDKGQYRTIKIAKKAIKNVDFIKNIFKNEDDFDNYVNTHKPFIEYGISYDNLDIVKKDAEKAIKTIKDCKGQAQEEMKNYMNRINYYFDKDNYKNTKNKISTINEELDYLKKTILQLKKEIEEGKGYKKCLKDKYVIKGLKAYNKIYGDDDTIYKLWKRIWKKLKHINSKELDDFVNNALKIKKKTEKKEKKKKKEKKLIPRLDTAKMLKEMKKEKKEFKKELKMIKKTSRELLNKDDVMKLVKEMNKLSTDEPVPYMAFGEVGDLMLVHLLKSNKNDCAVKVIDKGVDNKYIFTINIINNKLDKEGYGGLTKEQLKELIKAYKRCKEKGKILVVLVNLKRATDAHRNLLIFNYHRNEVERFEPHGAKTMATGYNNSKINNELKKVVSTINKEGNLNLKYVPASETCPTGFKGFQAYEASALRKTKTIDKVKITDANGYCMAWSNFYGDLRLKFPKKSGKKLNDSAMKVFKKNPEKLRAFIRGQTKWIIDEINKIVGKGAFEKLYIIDNKKQQDKTEEDRQYITDVLLKLNRGIEKDYIKFTDAEEEIEVEDLLINRKKGNVYVIEANKYFDYDFTKAMMSKYPEHYEYGSKHYFLFNTRQDRKQSLGILEQIRKKKKIKYELLNYVPSKLLEKYKEEEEEQLPKKEKKKDVIDVDDIIQKINKFIDDIDNSIKLLYKNNIIKILKDIETKEEAIKIVDEYRNKLSDKIVNTNNKLVDDLNPLLEKFDVDSDEYQKIYKFVVKLNKKQTQWKNAKKRFTNNMIKLIPKLYSKKEEPKKKEPKEKEPKKKEPKKWSEEAKEKNKLRLLYRELEKELFKLQDGRTPLTIYKIEKLGRKFKKIEDFLNSGYLVSVVDWEKILRDLKIKYEKEKYDDDEDEDYDDVYDIYRPTPMKKLGKQKKMSNEDKKRFDDLIKQSKDIGASQSAKQLARVNAGDIQIKYNICPFWLIDIVKSELKGIQKHILTFKRNRHKTIEELIEKLNKKIFNKDDKSVDIQLTTTDKEFENSYTLPTLIYLSNMNCDEGIKLIIDFLNDITKNYKNFGFSRATIKKVDRELINQIIKKINKFIQN